MAIGGEETWLREVLRYWDLGRIVRVERMGRGTNQRVWRVEAEQNWVLRRVEDDDGEAKLRREGVLLAALWGVGLPFRLPILVPTVDGEMMLRWKEEGTDNVFFCVQPMLPGGYRRRLGIGALEAAGQALGMLDQGLKVIEGIWAVQDDDVCYADLERIHRLVPDVWELETIYWADEEGRALLELLERVMDERKMLKGLPEQVIHGDYTRGNVLFDWRGKVSGVLDFELAGRDQRIFDFGIGLYHFVLVRPVERDVLARRIGAFAQGYSEWITLSSKEFAGLSLALRVRLMASVIHRYGCYRAGRGDLRGVRERIRAMMRCDRWLAEWGEWLVEVVRRRG